MGFFYRNLLSSSALMAVAICLAACNREAPAESTAAMPTEEVASPEPPPPDSAPVDSAPLDSGADAADEPDDAFVGWYFEKSGTALLQACGQAAPLAVADATMLRELKGKLGSAGKKPVYVRLRVRLAPGSKLEVSEVQQFGVDEGPTPDCVLVPGAT